MKKIFLFLCICCLYFYTETQAQNVNQKFKIGNLTFILSSDAQRNIQNRVNLLKEDKKKYQAQLQQAKLYMPLLADVFEQNQLPDDLKFLALLGNQNTYNLNFWHNLDSKAKAFGLQVNSEVDERENPVAFARAVARQLKQQGATNKNWFSSVINLISPDLAPNWLNTSGLLSLASNTEIALPNLAPTEFWQFLAYKETFDEDLDNDEELALIIEKNRNKTLEQIAKDDGIPVQKLRQYNTWVKDSKIPNDKEYDIILPIYAKSVRDENNLFGMDNDNRTYQASMGEGDIHEVKSRDNFTSIARKYNVSIAQLLSVNNLNINSNITPGQQLLIPSKNTTKTIRQVKKTTTNTPKIHQVEKGESIFAISRKYKVTVAQIKQWNNLSNANLGIGQRLKVSDNANDNTEKEINNDVVASQTKATYIPPVQNTPTITKNTPAVVINNRRVAIKSVPASMDLLGMKVNLSPQLRKNLEKDVEILMRNPTAFLNKVRRVDLYINLIDQQLKESGLPYDFRYLPIQESTLIGNAVSSSNAVGYWQFKEPAAKEMGLVINNNIDERMHILTSTDAAGKYLKRHQNYFQNWIYTLLSYNMGFGGGRRYVANLNITYKNLTTMNLDENIHWYIRKFIAHKIVFENELNVETPVRFLKPHLTQKKTIAEVAKETGTQASEFSQYNLWLRRGNTIPNDKNYSVIIPYKK
ncbi:MAG: LysM peptidoglycan-binding domain-containing protein [Bacteroidetes bacterium]|nr:MAG: LysM peptidoglycan-binding domain-containing protein [Bacteroidota bacterium]TAG87463.1 MAG: LysM peptidoglycan-binding domain-containing protein [Bacteroidota bacterium]